MLEERREIVEGKASFSPPVGLRLLVRPGEFLLGSWNLDKAEPTPCFSGHQVEELSVTLPAGRSIRLLPQGKTVENAYLRYQSAWKLDGQTVSVRRELTVNCRSRSARARSGRSWPRRSPRYAATTAA